MKKMLSFLFAALLAVSLSGCGKEVPPEPKKTLVGFSQLGAESVPWAQARLMPAYSATARAACKQGCKTLGFMT